MPKAGVRRRSKFFRRTDFDCVTLCDGRGAGYPAPFSLDSTFMSRLRCPLRLYVHGGWAPTIDDLLPAAPASGLRAAPEEKVVRYRPHARHPALSASWRASHDARIG